MSLYKLKIEKPVSRIPVIRELFKVLLMLVIIMSSLIVGIAEIFTNRKRWSVKRIIYFYKEIVEVLEYHGAEHKCINMYENANDLSALTVESARRFSRTHTRCGTNIIFFLIPLSVLYYFVAGQSFAMMVAGNVYDFSGSILLLGISIELCRLFQKPLIKWMLKPGIFLQRFVTTREPDGSQLEVAVKALGAVLL